MSVNKTGYLTDVYYQSFKDKAIWAIKSGCSILIMDDSVLSVDLNTLYIVNSDGTLLIINKGVYEIRIDNVLDSIDELVHRMLDDGFPHSGVETGIRFKEFEFVRARDEWIEVYMKPSIANELFCFRKDGVQ